MAFCQNCGANVGCGCQLKALPDGRQVCSACYEKLKASKSNVKQGTKEGKLPVFSRSVQRASVRKVWPEILQGKSSKT